MYSMQKKRPARTRSSSMSSDFLATPGKQHLVSTDIIKCQMKSRYSRATFEPNLTKNVADTHCLHKSTHGVLLQLQTCIACMQSQAETMVAPW